MLARGCTEQQEPVSDLNRVFTWVRKFKRPVRRSRAGLTELSPKSTKKPSTSPRASSRGSERAGQLREKPRELADLIDVGIRSGYVAGWHAAQAMVRQNRRLIDFTSTSGSAHYSLGPSYGAHKAAMDKMASPWRSTFATAKWT